MKFSWFCWMAAVVASSSTWCSAAEDSCSRSLRDVIEAPFVSPKIMLNGFVTDPKEGDFVLADVKGCCAMEGVDGSCEESSSPQNNKITIGTLQQQVIGQIPQMNEEQTMKVLEDAKQAWDRGSGTWPQMSLNGRVGAIEKFIEELRAKREEIVVTLMWEIGKNRNDAESEFDRTLSFVKQVIQEIRSDAEFAASWQTVGGVKAFVRRAAIGIIMCLGPFNYPLNETYATLIPALLMGNVVVMKIPTIGGLSHLLTMDAFSKALPPGAINFVSGGGRATMPPLMQSGSIDGLAFIGGSAAADDLIRQHPQPHRLKIFLQLEAKNMGIFLPDIFEKSKASELSSALDQSIVGSLSFNGQRCTALKLFFIPKAHADSFAKQLAERVEALSVGLPWQKWPQGDGSSTSFSAVTPLPDPKRIKVMQRLIEDATAKGAKILNKNGGMVVGGSDSTLMVPAVLYPVTEDMEVYHEEQFGPVIPITAYDSIDTVLEYGQNSIYGQQVSIFTSTGEVGTTTKLVDRFSTVYGKVNINSQCGRSPDTLPFSGRRSSAMGVMSVKHALMEFSIPTVVSYKDNDVNAKIMRNVEKNSQFLQPV